MNLALCGSPFIYSVEYKCTNPDMLVTTTNIIPVNESYCNPISTIPQFHSFIKVSVFDITTSLYIIIAITHVIPICITVYIPTPLLPIFRPSIPATIALTNGIHNINKYILRSEGIEPPTNYLEGNLSTN